MSRVIEPSVTSDSITNMETDESGNTLLISTNTTLYVYTKTKKTMIILYFLNLKLLILLVHHIS